MADFVDEPHSAIDGEPHGKIVNLTDNRAAPSRAAQIDILGTLGPDRIAREVKRLEPERPKPRAKATTIFNQFSHIL